MRQRNSFHEKHRECITACMQCAVVCEEFIVALLEDEKLTAVAGAIAIARACADTCFLTARLLAQDSEFANEYCALNVEVCHSCREACLKQPYLDACKICAEAALACEEICQRIVA